ncbi:MAG TPA: MmgE/PrpD family protein [Dehalococcoidia bacterium]|nr:2-methylcitrate dehydratase [Chloroflexota bacterium]HCP23310.1 MmgE/PrpD family protein [Dehalococcoidia bacterium]
MDRTTEMLASYACRLSYEDLGPKTVHQVKRTLVDTLGCAMGGFVSEPAKIARGMASSVTSTTPSRVLGTETYTSPDMAGFANGVMVRYLDCNDSYFSPGGGHPSDMITAVLAMADPMIADGRTVITSIALAYEVFCRLSDEVVAGDLGWDQGMFSVIGAACGAGKVLGLDQEQMGHAISLAVAPALPLAVTRTGELSMWKGCATAAATRSAVFAAMLAAEGMTGPGEPFEGKRGLWEQAVGKPVDIPDFPLGGSRAEDDPFRITQTIVKSYPSQIHTQSPIGLALELRNDVALADIQSIQVETYRSAVSSPATEPEKWDPKTRETADHSIPFLVATALQEGAVVPGTFTPQGIADPTKRQTLATMTLVEDPEFTANYPEQYNCRITITDQSGGVHTAHTAYSKGHNNNPLDDQELEGKFRNFSAGVLTDMQCDQVLGNLWAIDEATDMDEIFDGLVV